MMLYPLLQLLLLAVGAMKTEKWVVKKKKEETFWVVVYSLNVIFKYIYTYLCCTVSQLSGALYFLPLGYTFFFPIYFQCSFIPTVQHTISLSVVEFLNGRLFLIFIPFSTERFFMPCVLVVGYTEWNIFFLKFFFLFFK